VFVDLGDQVVGTATNVDFTLTNNTDQTLAVSGGIQVGDMSGVVAIGPATSPQVLVLSATSRISGGAELCRPVHWST
jgi:hypothetical protein